MQTSQTMASIQQVKRRFSFVCDGKDYHEFGDQSFHFASALDPGTLFVLASKEGREWRETTFPCFSCWYVVLTRRLFRGRLRLAQSNVQFGHPATLPGAAPLHLAVQLEKLEAVKLLLQHKVLWTRWLDLPLSEGYSKTVLTATVCFLQFPQMARLDQNAKWGAEMMRLPHWTPSNHRVLEDFGEASESPWLFVLHKGWGSHPLAWGRSQFGNWARTKTFVLSESQLLGSWTESTWLDAFVCFRRMLHIFVYFLLGFHLQWGFPYCLDEYLNCR